MPHRSALPLVVLLFVTPIHADDAPAAGSLEARLLAEGVESLAAAALERGDAKRGAVAFHQPTLACRNCHTTNGKGERTGALGPDLTTWPERTSTVHLVESMLLPSQKLRKGYETAVVVKDDGRVLTGLLVKETDEAIELKLPRAAGGRFGERVVVPRSEIDQWRRTTESLMPKGVVNQLGTRQQFLDLVAYVDAIAKGGPQVAAELEPPAALLTARPLPEYESHVDHARLIRGFDAAGHERGRAIYERLCANCHGTHDRPGTLPTSRKFGREPLKNGNDPYAIYQTLTRGFGMMVPQHWMVPRQKYDVVHYVREDYLKRLQPESYFEVTDEYLASLPPGDTLGPEPSNVQPWQAMNYGDALVNTYEFGRDGSNIAYKGIAVRLDGGPGGVSRGRAWAVFEHDTLRLAGFWTDSRASTKDSRNASGASGNGFIDWNGIHFNGRHNAHPRVVGEIHLQNRGPGWADPRTGSFADDQRVVGRDERRYGPLPREWGRYEGLYRYGSQAIVKYRVGGASVLEMPSLVEVGEGDEAVPVLVRSFEIGPRERAMTLSVAMREGARLAVSKELVTFGPPQVDAATPKVDAPKEAKVGFDGSTYLEVADGGKLDTTKPFTVTARIRTKRGGTIFARTTPGAEWIPNGQVLFVRGGRLNYDIGWVGVLRSTKPVADGKWHDVALSVDGDEATLFVDGEEAGAREFAPEEKLANAVVRLGYCAPDFPKPSPFRGDLRDVAFYGTALDEDDLARLAGNGPIESDRQLARWGLGDAATNGRVPGDPKGRFAAVVKHVAAAASEPAEASQSGTIVADSTRSLGLEWKQVGDRLCLVVPAGRETLRFNVWTAAVENAESARTVAASDRLPGPPRNLGTMTNGGPPAWPQPLVTQPNIGSDDGPFAVDVLTRPAENPWFARVRLTGFDFFADGNRAAVSAWDGDVWLVEGLKQGGTGSSPASERETRNGGESSATSTGSELHRATPAAFTGSELHRATRGLRWRRIASGMFQPLGVKVVDETIYVTCRDALVILRDVNGDGETDFYESLNSDHQVTEHFHEFAMGLQRDEEGNWYYAKSARHALPAIVPHHGTLLRISPDGERTDILANGFRAANGVCLNPDGTFFVTDQEGHWNPKNRINWVREGGFYGNMLGYHDVTDPSDDAMQPPLAWITNSFDRSPAELLWVDSDRWGPLNGRLLNLSYGYGKVYVVPHEKVGSPGEPLLQGGMSPLPLPNFPTGLVRGRFHPDDGQLYSAGMFAWAGSQQQPGGFYRIRYTGKPVHLPVEFHARKGELELGLTGDLDRDLATDPNNYTIRAWNLRRTQSYGSKHYDERTLKVTAVDLQDDGSVVLHVPDLAPTWGLSVRWDVESSTGAAVKGELHGTIHELR